MQRGVGPMQSSVCNHSSNDSRVTAAGLITCVRSHIAGKSLWKRGNDRDTS